MPTDNFAIATKAIEIAAGDTYSIANGDPIAFDFTNAIPSADTVSTATISVNKTTTPALTFANPTANGSTYVDSDGTTVAVGKAVQADITSAGKAGQDYLVTVVTTLSTGSTRGGRFRVQVR